MFEAHPTFHAPTNEDVKVWRYMDFTKLVSLLESRALHFTRADKFEDPYEGTWPRSNVNAMRYPGPRPENISPSDFDPDAVVSMFTDLRKFHAVNCWHMNEQESAAMWKLYLKTNEGIAVQTTYAGLKDSIIDSTPVMLGVVNYVDFDTVHIDQSNALNAIVHKRLSFEHEREIRAVAFLVPEIPAPIPETHLAAGVQVKVDLQKLVHRIFVAPDAPGWFVKLVEQVVHRYQLQSPVVQSGLYTRTLY